MSTATNDAEISQQIPELSISNSPVQTQEKLSAFVKYFFALKTFLPILQWLPSYNLKQFITSDLLSGISVCALHIPQGLAYGMLANLPPINGIYCGLIAPLIYMVFGTSHHVSVGTFGPISLMVGETVLSINSKAFNSSAEMEYICDNDCLSVIALVTVLSGFFQILLSVSRLGFIANYLSKTLVSGFLFGVSICVGTLQLGNMVGLKLNRPSEPFFIIFIWYDLIRFIQDVDLVTALISALTIIFLIIGKLVNVQLHSRKKLPVPFEPIALVFGIVFMYATTNFTSHVRVVGEVPSGFPAFSPPCFQLNCLFKYSTTALLLALVSFSMTVSIGKLFANIEGYKIIPSNELVALGFSNIIGGLFSCYTVSASPSRSAVQHAVGGKTQLVAVFSSIFLLCSLFFLSFLFEKLPIAQLSAIIAFALHSYYLQILEVPSLFKYHKLDFVIWTVTSLTTVLLGVDIGLICGIFTSLITLALRFSFTNADVLFESAPGVYTVCQDSTLSKVRIFRFNQPMLFTNADIFASKLLDCCLTSKNGRSLASTVIIDFTRILFLDKSGTSKLAYAITLLKKEQVEVILCQYSSDVLETLKNDGILVKLIPEDKCFSSLQDAVLSVSKCENSVL